MLLAGRSESNFRFIQSSTINLRGFRGEPEVLEEILIPFLPQTRHRDAKFSFSNFSTISPDFSASFAGLRRREISTRIILAYSARGRAKVEGNDGLKRTRINVTLGEENGNGCC